MESSLAGLFTISFSASLCAQRDQRQAGNDDLRVLQTVRTSFIRAAAETVPFPPIRATRKNPTFLSGGNVGNSMAIGISPFFRPLSRLPGSPGSTAFAFLWDFAA